MMGKKKLFLTIVFVICSCLSLSYASDKDVPTLFVFHSLSCHKCIQAKNEIIPVIEKEYQGKVIIKYYDIADIRNYSLLIGFRDKYDKAADLTVPVFFMGTKFLKDKSDLKNNLRNFINSSVVLDQADNNSPQADLSSYFKDVKLLAILGAGLTDGINPCAFTVIVFFISYLALQGYRKRELIVIGSTFILAVFLTYFFIGIGLFNFLYNLKSFWFLIRIFNLSIGVLSIILGFIALYDLYKLKKTNSAENLILQLPKVLKNQIHSVIGLHYRKSKAKGADEEAKLSLARLSLSALVTGFLVSILEAVCTGQLYLPTLAFMLRTEEFRLRAFSYITIYNIMFILPLLIIFLLALFGVTSVQFANFFKKNLSKVKILMAFVFFSLGLFLIWKG